MSVENNLPYKAEYAKSGRASCKGCKTTIDKGTLRLAVMTKSRFHDGKDANWHHVDCFFAKAKPQSVGDIGDFESLRYEDQEMMKKRIGAVSNGAKAGGSAMRKETKEDYKVEYAKSAQSTCVACEESIKKNVVRIGKKDYLSDRAMMHGPFFRWHHLDCFVKIRSEVEIGFYDAGKNLPGYKDLDEDDMKLVVSKLPAIAAGKRKLEEDKPSGSGEGKRSKLSKVDNSADLLEEKIKAQNTKMYKYRDILEKYLKKKDFARLLTKNKQEIPTGEQLMLDRLSDVITFGALLPCEICKTGQFVYRSGVGYQCMGDLTEFTKCSQVVDEPKRVAFKLSQDYKDTPGLENYQCKITKRIIPKHAAPVEALKTASKTAALKVNSKPLDKFKIGIDDAFSKSEQAKMNEKIDSFGGKVTSRLSEKVAFFISTSEKVDKLSSKIKKAKELKIPVVSKDFVGSIKEVKYNLAESIKIHLISDWVDDIRGRLLTLNEGYEKIPEKKRNNGLELEMEKSKKLIMKNGAIVEPDSDLQDIGHVLKIRGQAGYYNAVLNLVDIEQDKNSFYKLQVIESDNKPYQYWVYRAWGRIGTKIGGQKISEDLSQSQAIEEFKQVYEDQTGNEWGAKFVKKPKKYTALEIDYSDKETVNKIVPSKSKSSLPLSIQELICLIFDVDKMKQTMIEFEIDMEKMPLGKMSRQQILNAYSALNKAMERLGAKASNTDRMLIDASTRFFSLIPHNFGLGNIPVLDTDAAIKNKIDMLDNLLEIELAYELLKEDSGDDGSVDKFYKKLHTDIDILEGNSEEYKVIQKYLENTHASTHDSYKLQIDQVYKINRKDEKKRYQPFKDLHNRKLLWHGSRTTNYVGILSQGLRIAPPEAPVTGYMFGKGIYFADMVSKSANYCFTSPGNSTGLMMLCEVALGDMHERTKAKETLTKAPEKTNSVKGCGSTHPDPAEIYTFPDGVEVPYGKPVNTKKSTSLMYNEYIVYDVAQVNIRYLLKVDFKYKGKR